MVKIIQILIGICIAAAGVFIFTRQVDLGVVGEVVLSTPPWKIACVMLFNVGTLYFRALRWRVLLPDRIDSSKTTLFPLVCIGFMVNNFVPMRIGEAVRALLLWRRNGYTIPESVGSILIERLLDILVFCTFLITPVLLLPQLHMYTSYAIMLSSGIAFVAGVFALYAFRPNMVMGLGSKMVSLLPAVIGKRLAVIGKEIISNLDWLFSSRKTILVVALSFITLFWQIAMLYILGTGVEQLSVLVSMFGVAFAAVGAAIPLAPGYVGTLHAMVLKGLGMAGVAADSAGALAVLFHAIGYVTVAFLGLLFFVRLKVSVNDIRNAGELSKKKRSN